MIYLFLIREWQQKHLYDGDINGVKTQIFLHKHDKFREFAYSVIILDEEGDCLAVAREEWRMNLREKERTCAGTRVCLSGEQEVRGREVMRPDERQGERGRPTLSI